MRVNNEPYWDAGDLTVTGLFTPYGIDLAKGMRSWAHELLHARDFARWHVGSDHHAGWDTNGYYEAAWEYEREAGK